MTNDRRHREHARARAVALDREMLERIASCGARGVTLPKMFGGLTPLWAVEATRRLDDAGLVTRDRDGVFTLTAAGHERLRRPPPTQTAREG